MFFFPCAGSGAADYATWTKWFPPTVELYAIRYPGRESRFKEKPYAGWSEARAELVGACAQQLDIPFAFFGHSLGALLAFETAHSLWSQYRSSPQHLFIFACHGPRLPLKRAPVAQQPNGKLLEYVQGLCGIPSDVAQNTELMALLLPAIRADMALAETYRYVSKPPLPCPITVYGGKDDVEVLPQELDAWEQETSGEFHLEMLACGHFLSAGTKDEMLQSMLRKGVLKSSLNPASALPME